MNILIEFICKHYKIIEDYDLEKIIINSVCAGGVNMKCDENILICNMSTQHACNGNGNLINKSKFT